MVLSDIGAAAAALPHPTPHTYTNTSFALVAGIVGVAQVDTFGDIIPPRTLSPQRDGAFGWVPRQGAHVFCCTDSVECEGASCLGGSWAGL